MDHQGLIPDLSLCFEVYGQADTYLNLISDSWVSVNAHYTAVGPFHIIDQVAIRASDGNNNCHNVLITTNNSCSASIDGVAVDSFSAAGLSVRRLSGRVRVSVPNCAREKLVMWIICQDSMLQTHDDTSDEIFQTTMIKFVVARGFNLQPKSHGILGL